MFTPSLILLTVGFLVLICILASRASDRLGVPALIVFLCIGMLAGENGPGGIQFDNARSVNLLGAMALALILFSGGLSTNWRLVRPVAAPGFILATFGVVVTAGLDAIPVPPIPIRCTFISFPFYRAAQPFRSYAFP